MMYLNTSVNCVRCLKGDVARLKAAHAGEVHDATCRVATDQSVRLDALSERWLNGNKKRIVWLRSVLFLRTMNATVRKLCVNMSL